MNRNKKSQQKTKKAGKVPKQPSLTSYAAAATSSSLSQYVRFSAGSRDGSLRIHYRLPVVQIGNSGTTGHGGFLTSNGTYSSSIGLNTDSIDDFVAGTSDYWQSVGLNLMAECFSRYKHSGSARFHYCPQSTSTNADRLIFAFSSDPYHPLINIGLTDFTTQTNLLGLRESMPFAPWNNWSMNVHVDTIQKYVYSSSIGSEPDQRFNSFGAMGCVGLSSVSSPTVYGVLYIEGDAEFEDMNPLVILTGTPTSRLQKHKKKVLVEEKNKDEEEIVERPKGWFSTSAPPSRK